MTTQGENEGHVPRGRKNNLPHDKHQGRFGHYWHKLQHWLRLDELSPQVRRIVVAVVGGTLLLLGIAMVILPGPAFIVIPLALALLGTEFVWARRCVQKARNLFGKLKHAATSQ